MKKNPLKSLLKRLLLLKDFYYKYLKYLYLKGFSSQSPLKNQVIGKISLDQIFKICSISILS